MKNKEVACRLDLEVAASLLARTPTNAITRATRRAYDEVSG